jgi:hypothetical protein
MGFSVLTIGERMGMKRRKSLDYKGRWRNHTVAFRVSDEEAKLSND